MLGVVRVLSRILGGLQSFISIIYISVRKFIYWNINNKHSPPNIKGIFILCILDHTIFVKQISSKSFPLYYKNITHKNIIVYNNQLRANKSNAAVNRA